MTNLQKYSRDFTLHLIDKFLAAEKEGRSIYWPEVKTDIELAVIQNSAKILGREPTDLEILGIKENVQFVLAETLDN